MSTADPSPLSAGLISHGATAPSEAAAWEATRQRLRAAGDLPETTVDQQLALFDELTRSELGRFLIANRGLNAYWTHRLVSYPQGALRATMGALERQFFEELPTALATRERYGIFCREVAARLRPGLVGASVPGGLLSEWLAQDPARLREITVVGVDLDPEALEQARALAEQRGVAERVVLRCEDAWALSLREEVDVLSSNGLNIYEPDEQRVRALYQAFFRALKPGGSLISSFLTPPPALSPHSPWRLEAIDAQAAALQRVLFMRVIEAKWNALRTHEETAAQLRDAGFVDIEFIDDRARQFPTLIARRPE